MLTAIFLSFWTAVDTGCLVIFSVEGPLKFTGNVTLLPPTVTVTVALVQSSVRSSFTSLIAMVRTNCFPLA